MNLLETMCQRRSVRKYTNAPLPEGAVEQILQAGLLSESGKNIQPWEFVVVDDKDILQKLSNCRAGSVPMLANCQCAIIVLGDDTKTDVWIEDCSVAMAHMHLMADSLGIGSCWIQSRLRTSEEGNTTEEFVQHLLSIPSHMKVEAILSLGMPEDKPAPHCVKDCQMGKVHHNQY